MLKSAAVFAVVVFLSGCVSYYDSYENDYYAADYGSYYNSPLRLRGLGYNDFYMLDNYPRDYFDTQLWSAISNITRFSIVSISHSLSR